MELRILGDELFDQDFMAILSLETLRFQRQVTDEHICDISFVLEEEHFSKSIDNYFWALNVFLVPSILSVVTLNKETFDLRFIVDDLTGLGSLENDSIAVSQGLQVVLIEFLDLQEFLDDDVNGLIK